MTLEEGKGLMIFRENISRPAYLEEIIHHNQKLKYGEEYFLKNRNLLEIEAQDELLKMGKEEKWSQSAIDEIQKAKQTWQKKLDEETNSRKSGTSN